MPRLAATTLLLTVLGAVLVVALGLAVASGLSDPFDEAIIGVVRSAELREPLTPLRAVTELASTPATVVLAVAAVLIGLAIGRWRDGLAGAAVIGLVSAGNSLLKLVIARERPDLLDPIVVEHGYSFPSGHSILGMTGWGILAILLWRSRLPRALRVGLVVVSAVLVGAIGLSRVYLGVHYPSDVLAGWTLGAMVVGLYAALTRTASTAPAAGAVDADRAAPRSDRPAAG